tara:strand:- start:399 stop:530 length:132 start_codon:yes stop_codon:yes gene_type:complete
VPFETLLRRTTKIKEEEEEEEEEEGEGIDDSVNTLFTNIYIMM